MELDDIMRKALFAAIPILEKMPDAYRAETNINDMREILAGRSSGRGSVVIVEALATMLAYRTNAVLSEPMKSEPPADADDFVSDLNRRLHEFIDLFAVIARIDPWCSPAMVTTGPPATHHCHLLF